MVNKSTKSTINCLQKNKVVPAHKICQADCTSVYNDTLHLHECESSIQQDENKNVYKQK